MLGGTLCLTEHGFVKEPWKNQLWFLAGLVKMYKIVLMYMGD